MGNRSPRHTQPGQWNLKGKKTQHCACRCCSVFNLREATENVRVANEEIRPATIADAYPSLDGIDFLVETGVDDGLPDTRQFDEHDRGAWSIFTQKPGEIGIISSDFKHDVVLYVNGDFADDESKMEYTRLIANRLNRTIPQ